jgi:nitrogen-specific signal transduction histidine kinase
MDDGQEYIIKELNKLADALGQLVKRTTLYTPEQDSKSEQSIHTILDRAKYICINQNIPKFL